MPRWECAKVVMKAKYDYRMAIQEARMIRCSMNSKSQKLPIWRPSVRMLPQSPLSAQHCCREHVKHIHELEQQALRCRKQKSPRLSFCMSSYRMPCSTAPQRESVCLLPHLVRAITFISLIYSICQDTPGRGATICNCFSQARTQTVSMAKKAWLSSPDPQGDMSVDETSPTGLAGSTIKLQEKRDCWLVHFPKAQLCGHLQLWFRPHKRSQITLLYHSPLGLNSWQHWTTSPTSLRS